MKEEVAELLNILAKRRPRFILEIGTAWGGTLFLFTRTSSPDATIISLDLSYPEEKMSFYKSFAIHKQKMILMLKDSHAMSTFKMVEKMLGEHKLDFLFIDGDHSYEGVKKDFEMYYGLVNKGGIIAFHDILPQTGCDVIRLWRQIKDGYEHTELVGDPEQGWGGIGVLYV